MKLLPCVIAALATVCLSHGASAQDSRGGTVYPANYTKHVIPAGRVVIFRLTRNLSSDHVRVGELFVATLDTANVGTDPVSLVHAVALGHVTFARPKTAKAPGVMGVDFFVLRKDDGYDFPLHGSLIAVSSHTIEKKNGWWYVKPTYKADNLKFVGNSPNGGPLAQLVTRGDLVSDAMIAKALGWSSKELEKHKNRFSEAFARTGTPYGILLNQDLVYYAPRVH